MQGENDKPEEDMGPGVACVFVRLPHFADSPVWLSLPLCTSLLDRKEPGGPVLLGACRHNGGLTHSVANSQ